MKKIGLLSDTHGILDPRILEYFADRDELWHAGDFGSMKVVEQLRALNKPLRGVYGNVDGQEIRRQFPETGSFRCEEVEIFMVHIGTPYLKRSSGGSVFNKASFDFYPKVFVCGHSHILKIAYDKEVECLYMNPGAAGNQGWQKVRTCVTFSIDQAEIIDCRVYELQPRYLQG